MKKRIVIFLFIVLALGSITGCSRLNSMLGIQNPTPTHKVKMTHTPAPAITPTPTKQAWAGHTFTD